MRNVVNLSVAAELVVAHAQVSGVADPTWHQGHHIGRIISCTCRQPYRLRSGSLGSVKIAVDLAAPRLAKDSLDRQSKLSQYFGSARLREPAHDHLWLPT